MGNQKGFTLIELLVVVAIIGILAELGITSFSIYRANAAYANAQVTMRQARTAVSAGTMDLDNPPASVPLSVQDEAGPMQDALVAAFMPSMVLPKNTRFQVEYDPTCNLAGCISSFAEVKHCSGKKFIRWIRYGDGQDLVMDIDGTGCA